MDKAYLIFIYIAVYKCFVFINVVDKFSVDNLKFNLALISLKTILLFFLR